MKIRFDITSVAVGLMGVMLLAVGCKGRGIEHSDGHDHGHHEEAPLVRGPHKGRLLSCKEFSVELSIFESGTPPQFRLYAYRDSAPISPSDVSAAVELKRLGGVTNAITFKPVSDFLESDQVVYEPHSFDVKVRVTSDGTSCEWTFSSYEARTTIPAEVAQRAGIVAEVAGPREITSTIRARGKILPSEHRIAHIIPRFSGVVREGRKHVGDSVEKGEVVAIIESNQSLQPYEVRAQIPGTVINGHLIVGEFVPDNQWIYIVADLSVVWADLFVPLREAKGLAVGQDVTVSSVNSDAKAQGKVTYLAPYADDKSQSRLVRVELPNPGNEFLPGAHVTGDIVIERAHVPVAVRRNGLQRYNQWLVVFGRDADAYEARPVETGREDSEWVEITSGLPLGAEYVAENAFLVKADILKSGATHDH